MFWSREVKNNYKADLNFKRYGVSKVQELEMNPEPFKFGLKILRFVMSVEARKALFAAKSKSPTPNSYNKTIL